MKGRRRIYFALMGTCLLLFLLSGTVIARFSGPAAVAVAIVALAIPPFAVIVANRSGGPRSGGERDGER
ncbi:hypothetical protein Pth03_81900 [Planotetraspora thailandica]|uniref:DUF3099 domain-containing protein n=1 Tax=Planotetraspora thailandica TaxID=487172 RepID=A0A8J3Y2Z9_9ACTN|nr:hypothetical protein Pth03_81900 [Planotetraspora thailandica]